MKVDGDGTASQPQAFNQQSVDWTNLYGSSTGTSRIVNPFDRLGDHQPLQDGVDVPLPQTPTRPDQQQEDFQTPQPTLTEQLEAQMNQDESARQRDRSLGATS